MNPRNTPKQLENPDFKKLKESCLEYIQEIANSGYIKDDDLDHYIFEDALEAIYGKDIWDFINYEEDIKE